MERTAKNSGGSTPPRSLDSVTPDNGQTLAPEASMVERIEDTLQRRLKAARVEVVDDSHRHRGHAGAREGGHYNVAIVSEAFRGKGPVERHRLVYQALEELMTGIHALQIRALTPDQAI